MVHSELYEVSFSTRRKAPSALPDGQRRQHESVRRARVLELVVEIFIIIGDGGHGGAITVDVARCAWRAEEPCLPVDSNGGKGEGGGRGLSRS